MIKRIFLISTMAMALVACDSGGELVNDLSTLLGAATDHPCAADVDYQTELNGAPDDTSTSSEVVEGVNLITEEHWYDDLQMIVFYRYEENGSWCNMWNESGVDWVK